jgi:hypothetical protein
MPEECASSSHRIEDIVGPRLDLDSSNEKNILQCQQLYHVASVIQLIT